MEATETGIVLTDPKPVAKDKRCPGTFPGGRACGAGPDKRVPSSGFGRPHDVCRECGHEFEEFTSGR